MFEFSCPFMPAAWYMYVFFDIKSPTNLQMGEIEKEKLNFMILPHINHQTSWIQNADLSRTYKENTHIRLFFSIVRYFSNFRCFISIIRTISILK